MDTRHLLKSTEPKRIGGLKPKLDVERCQPGACRQDPNNTHVIDLCSP
jgi:hypothetical protein